MNRNESDPVGWARATMQDVATVVGGGTPSTTNPAFWTDGDVAWITPADLSGYRQKTISRGARNITDLALKRSGATMLPTGTVLFSSRAPIGYVAIASNPVSTNQGFKSFVLEPGIAPDYIYYYLQFAKPLAVALASGTTFQEISGRKARVVPVVVAPGAEQIRIVEATESHLSRLDDAVASLERVKAKLKAYRASVLNAAVQGRLVPTEASVARAENRAYEPAELLLARILKERRRRWEEAELAKLKAAGKTPTDDRWKASYSEPANTLTSALNDLPEGWYWTTVGQLAFIASGQTPSGIMDCLKATGDLPWFRVGDMNTRGNESFMRNAKEWLTHADQKRLGLHVRPAGTIIFPKRGGAIATNKKRRLSRPSAYDLNTMGVVPVGAIDVYLWLWFLKLDLGSLSDGSNVPQINHADIEPLPVQLPPLREQERIASEIDRLVSVTDAALAVVAANLERCSRLRQAVLKWAFEGKLVDQDPADEPAERLLARIQAERNTISPMKKARGRQARGAP